MGKRWFEELEHTADVGIHVYGASLRELFHNAAHGMVHLADVMIRPEQTRWCAFTGEAPDVETLLVDWLSQLAYLMETERIAFIAGDLQVTPTQVSGGFAAASIKQTHHHIKAVTYHNLAVKQNENDENGVTATIIFDV